MILTLLIWCWYRFITHLNSFFISFFSLPPFIDPLVCLFWFVQFAIQNIYISCEKHFIFLCTLVACFFLAKYSIFNYSSGFDIFFFHLGAIVNKAVILSSDAHKFNMNTCFIFLGQVPRIELLSHG